MHVRRIFAMQTSVINILVLVADMRLMRRYIALCKKQNPEIPASLTDRIVGYYCNMRKEARCHIFYFEIFFCLKTCLPVADFLANL